MNFVLDEDEELLRVGLLATARTFSRFMEHVALSLDLDEDISIVLDG